MTIYGGRGPISLSFRKEPPYTPDRSCSALGSLKVSPVTSSATSSYFSRIITAILALGACQTFLSLSSDRATSLSCLSVSALFPSPIWQVAVAVSCIAKPVWGADTECLRFKHDQILPVPAFNRFSEVEQFFFSDACVPSLQHGELIPYIGGERLFRLIQWGREGVGDAFPGPWNGTLALTTRETTLLKDLLAESLIFFFSRKQRCFSLVVASECFNATLCENCAVFTPTERCAPSDAEQQLGFTCNVTDTSEYRNAHCAESEEELSDPPTFLYNSTQNASAITTNISSEELSTVCGHNPFTADRIYSLFFAEMNHYFLGLKVFSVPVGLIEHEVLLLNTYSLSDLLSLTDAIREILVEIPQTKAMDFLYRDLYTRARYVYNNRPFKQEADPCDQFSTCRFFPPSIPPLGLTGSVSLLLSKTVTPDFTLSASPLPTPSSTEKRTSTTTQEGSSTLSLKTSSIPTQAGSFTKEATFTATEEVPPTPSLSYSSQTVSSTEQVTSTVTQEVSSTDKVTSTMSREVSSMSSFKTSTTLTQTPTLSLTSTKIFPGKPFGCSEWLDYFGAEASPCPPLPLNIFDILSAPCPIWGNNSANSLRVADTHMLVLIPRFLNNLEFTMNMLRTVVQSPLKGDSTQIDTSNSWSAALAEWEPKPVLESHWILMTKSILPDSAEKTYAEQVQIVASLTQRTGLSYVVPNLFNAVTSVLLEKVRTGNMLYPSTLSVPWSRVPEQTNGYRLVFGYFMTSGLRVIGHINTYGGDEAISYIGVSALIKL